VSAGDKAPQFFTTGLAPLGALGTQEQTFVTQKTVPEPAALAFAELAGFALARRRWHRS
jgi:hypothetical protein